MKMIDDIANSVLALGSMVIDLEIKTRTISQILVDEKIVTAEEIDERYKSTAARDFAEIKAGIEKLTEEYAKEGNKTEK